jgi:hypothetical protein
VSNGGWLGGQGGGWIGDCWGPGWSWTLEFFCQSDDDDQKRRERGAFGWAFGREQGGVGESEGGPEALRRRSRFKASAALKRPRPPRPHPSVDFLRGAEALQLYCEVRGDAHYTADRCGGLRLGAAGEAGQGRKGVGMAGRRGPLRRPLHGRQVRRPAAVAGLGWGGGQAGQKTGGNGRAERSLTPPSLADPDTSRRPSPPPAAPPPRWLRVGRELLQRPFYWDRVQAALALSLEEQEDFLVRLGARDLAADAEERTVAHLLLRADSVNRARVDWRRLKARGAGGLLWVGASARARAGCVHPPPCLPDRARVLKACSPFETRRIDRWRRSCRSTRRRAPCGGATKSWCRSMARPARRCRRAAARAAARPPPRARLLPRARARSARAASAAAAAAPRAARAAARAARGAAAAPASAGRRATGK